MPGASHCLSDHQPFGERPAVVSAGGAGGEYLAAASYEDHGFPVRVPQERAGFDDAHPQARLA